MYLYLYLHLYSTMATMLFLIFGPVIPPSYNSIKIAQSFLVLKSVISSALAAALLLEMTAGRKIVDDNYHLCSVGELLESMDETSAQSSFVDSIRNPVSSPLLHL